MGGARRRDRNASTTAGSWEGDKSQRRSQKDSHNSPQAAPMAAIAGHEWHSGRHYTRTYVWLDAGGSYALGLLRAG